MSNILPLPPSTPPPLDDSPSPGDDDEFGDFAIAPLGPSISQETQVSKCSSDLSIPSHHSQPSYPTSPPSTPIRSIAKEEPASNHSILLEDDEEESIYLTFANAKKRSSISKDPSLFHPPSVEENTLDFRYSSINDKEPHLLPESSQTFHSTIHECDEKGLEKEPASFCDGFDVNSYLSHLNKIDLIMPNADQVGDVYNTHIKVALDANKLIYNQDFHGDCDTKSLTTKIGKISSHQKEVTFAPPVLSNHKLIKNSEDLFSDESEDCQTHFSETNALSPPHIRNSSSLSDEDDCDIENNFKNAHCDLPNKMESRRGLNNSANYDDSTCSFSQSQDDSRMGKASFNLGISRDSSLPSSEKHISNFDDFEDNNELSNAETSHNCSLAIDNKKVFAAMSKVDDSLEIGGIEQEIIDIVVEPSFQYKAFQNDTDYIEPKWANAVSSTLPAKMTYASCESSGIDFEGINQIAKVASNFDSFSSKQILGNNLENFKTSSDKIENPPRDSPSSEVHPAPLDGISVAQDDDFGEFEEAYTKPLESFEQGKESALLPSSSDGFADFQDPISSGADGSWANFESCPTTVINEPQEFSKFEVAESPMSPSDDDFSDFKDASESSTYSEAPPSGSISGGNLMKSAESLSHIFSEVFPFQQSASYLEEELTFPPLVTVKAQKILEHLQDTESTPEALRFIWAHSQAFQLMLSALHIDSTLLTPSVPLFATGLGLLEPTPIESTNSFKTSPSQQNGQKQNAGSSIPEVYFDWSQSGLVNPLDPHRPASPLNLDFFVAQGELDQELSSPSVTPSTPPAVAPAHTMPKVPSLLTNLLSKVPPPLMTEELSDEAKSVLTILPDLSFMSSPVLMFPILHP